MKITPTEDSLAEVHTYTRRIRFDGAEATAITGYSHRGKHFIPDFAIAKWEYGKPIHRIDVIGNVLKKDGTPGQNRAEVRYETPASISWNTPFGTNAPEWLIELFADSKPTA
jgi:hypothetical protein